MTDKPGDQPKMATVTDLGDYRVVKAVEEQSPFTVENSNLLDAIKDSKTRAKTYKKLALKAAQELYDAGMEPYPCCNMVCEHYCQDENIEVIDGIHYRSGRKNYCKAYQSHECMFQMDNHPPNKLSYNEYMPSHVEALDMLEKHSLLAGDREVYEKANVHYGKPSSQAERSETKIENVTFRQLEQVILTVLHDLPPGFANSDHNVLARNITIEAEKAMGVFPNIGKV